MKQFMDEEFLLSTTASQRIYHSYAQHMPILDYHCHINPKEICEDRRFDTITQVWLGGDHYKWRLMRAAGVEEKYITGDASDREKFRKWAGVLEMAIGNPLYHWSNLELKRYFGYEEVLNSRTEEDVWSLCNDRLQHDPDMTVRGLIRQSGVTLICTTDDPVDTLEYHERLADDKSFDVQVLPGWRPDKALNIEDVDFIGYLARLEEVSGVEIVSFRTLLDALEKRMDYFAEHGCLVSDHALEYVMYAPASDEKIEEIFKKRLEGKTITSEEKSQFKTAIMLCLGRSYHRRGWVMQLHYGCKRDNNRHMYQKLGPNTGYDCISNYAPSGQMADFLNALDESDELPKTILYSLNPQDNAAIVSVLGCFQGSFAVSKLQQGCAWWFNDHKAGITEQMLTLANLGYLAGFVGMLTDSRSFLSYTRHEYFRRVLCEMIGGWVDNGEFPDDPATLEKIIKGICYNNAVSYFGFNLESVW